MNEPRHIFSSGAFETEQDAMTYLDKEAKLSGAFSGFYPEVNGRYLSSRPHLEEKQPRIDRIFIPSQALIAAGWTHGPIGIEGKRSDTKLGKATAQALDYAGAAFEIKQGFHIVLEWIFIWPLQSHERGALFEEGSVMAQNRIGWVRASEQLPLAFGCEQTNGIKLHRDGTIEARTLPMGRKRGSR